MNNSIIGYLAEIYCDNYKLFFNEIVHESP